MCKVDIVTVLLLIASVYSLKFVVSVDRLEGSRCFFQALSTFTITQQPTKNISSKQSPEPIKNTDSKSIVASITTNGTLSFPAKQTALSRA
jgi:hypothetical protein